MKRLGRFAERAQIRSDALGCVRMCSDALRYVRTRFARGQGLEQLHADVEEMVLRPKAGVGKAIRDAWQAKGVDLRL